MQTQLTVKQQRFYRGRVAATARPGTAAHKHRHTCPWLRVFTRCSWHDPPALTQLFFPLAKQVHWEMRDQRLGVWRFQMQLLTCPWISHATLASYLGAGGRGTHKAGFRRRRALANHTSHHFLLSAKKGQDQSLWATVNLAECSPWILCPYL